MHIPENYLTPQTCAVMTAVMLPVWKHSIHRVSTEISKEKLPLLGVGAAFSFLAMMFNIPIFGGTAGHAVGGTLAAILLGPDAACIAVTIALLIQALLFGDGGILAFGANCFNMAFVLPYLGYAIYDFIRSNFTSRHAEFSAAAIGSFVGINAAALCAAIEFGLQPMLSHDAAGRALYCPYDLSVSIPSMMIGHLTIFGVAEVIFTTTVLAFIRKTSPNLIPSAQGKTASQRPLVYLLIALLTFAAPVGLLAQGTAWGEWDTSEIANVVVNGSALGYTPAGMQNGFQLSVLFPDYTMAGLPDTVAYLLSAVIGVALVIVFFRLLSAFIKPKTNFD